MGLAKLIRNVLGNRGSASATVHKFPLFESLEPRLLLSADGLGTFQSDPLANHSDLVPAIEVDFEYDLAQPRTGVKTTQNQETVTDPIEWCAWPCVIGGNGA